MTKLRFVLVLAFTVTCFAQSINADSIIFDDFDDGQLDPRWQVSFTYADGWTYKEAGTNLTVNDISNTVFNEALNDLRIGWSTVTLSQSFSPVSNFQTKFNFSWDSEGKVQPEQYVWIELLDAEENVIVRAGYRDAWVENSGGSIASIGDSAYSSGPETLPLSGSAMVEILRTDDFIDIVWNGINLISGVNTANITKVELSFGYYANIGWNGDFSFFGTESIDQVVFEGTLAAAPTCPLISMSYNVECLASDDWVRVRGEVVSYDGEPLCAMVLSNGQHMFTCNSNLGVYDLTVPVDENGRVTVFGFVNGYQPSRKILTAPVCSP